MLFMKSELNIEKFHRERIINIKIDVFTSETFTCTVGIKHTVTSNLSYEYYITFVVCFTRETRA